MYLFKENQRVALYIEKNDMQVEIVCTIDRVCTDRLFLNLPKYFMRYIDILKVGTKIMVKVFAKSGTIDFNSIIITSPLEESFAIELDYNAIKFVDDNDIMIIEDILPLIIKTKDETINTKTIEISNKDLKFISEEGKFKINQDLNFSLQLPKDYGIINFRGIITQIDEIYENEYTTTYSIISDKDRQNLLYYIYMYNNN